MGSKRKRKDRDVSTVAPDAKRQQKDTQKPSTEATSPPPIDTSPFLDNPRGADLKREVQLYDALGSEDGLERLGAANAIVSGLLGGTGVEESTLQKHLERRLFRGLASGRKGSRLGFSVVLTEILSELFGTKDLAAQKYSNLTFDRILGFLVAKTKPEGDLSGQEEKDHALGLLFGLQSFVRSNILFGATVHWNEILDRLLGLAKKKPWIREECGWVIVEALAQMSQSQAEYTLEQLCDAGLAPSPEGVGIWLTARNRFPDMKLPSKPWGQSGNPLDHLETLGKSLKESSSGNQSAKEKQQATQTGSWNSKLHFVWNILLAQYAQDATANGNTSNFENFWKVAVDENLFASTASPERKFWGFLLFQKLFQDHLSYETLLPSIFSHNLVLCLINQLQGTDRLLNRAAEKSLKVLVQAAEANSQVMVAVLPHLIGGHGTYNFDTATKTKTVEKLLGLVNDKNANSVIEILQKPVLSIEGLTDFSTDATKQAEMRRQLFLDYLLSIIRRVNVQDDSRDLSWVKKSALPTIATMAYCEDAQFQPSLTPKIRGLSRDRLMSCFAHLLPDLRGYSFPCDLVKALEPDAVKMDAKIAEARDGAISTMGKILKKTKKADAQDKAPLQALALLYSLVVFQLYNGEPEAISTIDELKLFYDRLIRHKDSGDSEVEASEVMVELLLSFISKPSALLRKVTQHVFTAFMTDITIEGLKLITDVLESSENLRGQQEMFDQQPEDGDQVEDDSDIEMDSDVEVIDMNGEEGQLTTNLDEDEESNEEENSDGDEPAEEDEEAKKLDAALALALGTKGLDPDAEESDSDANMTDSEMMALDSKLVEIFSQRKKATKPKKEHKEAKETIVNFKSRVLDLLEIFVKKQPGNPLAFGLLLPLLQLIRTTKTKKLADRASNIIQTFQQAAKKHGKAAGEVNVSKQVKLMKAIHLEASKDPSHMFAKAASTSSLMLASSCYRADKGSFEKLAAVYTKTQVAWVNGEVKLSVILFNDWTNWCQNHANANT
ncbi:DNA polymerase V [Lachnellula arida]|uniref:DNA polymerase V n=1 Tax=Lachnellula arida TaxID=1316785 RepID=A0A8T9B7D8_9HELO|nr:DNA polymerase V [Lachnellula arida]